MGGPGSGVSLDPDSPTKVLAKLDVDWAAYYAEWLADWEPNGESLAAFGRYKGINTKTMANKMKMMKQKDAVKTAHARNKSLLLRSQKKVSAAIDQPNVEPEFALKVFKATFEREEPNAQIASQVNIMVPPMFASSVAMEAAQKLMRPEGADNPQAKAIEVLVEKQ